MTDLQTSIEEVVRPSGHIFISPHYDDIALSCGGTAALLAMHGREPLVVLLFGSEPDPSQPLSAFAQDLHRQWGMAAHEVIAGRRQEEAAASAVLKTHDVFAPFQDAIYRGTQYTGNELLFGAPGADDAALPDAIIDWLNLPGAPDDSSRIYAPLAVGNHVDHEIAFRAGIELANRGWPVWFFEDLPYGLRKGAVDQRLRSSGDALSVGAVVDISEQWETKIEAIMAYPSQLAVIFEYVECGHSRDEIDNTLSTYAREVSGGEFLAERFWKLDEQ
ncbi:MAG: PIG-L deacetylase family protein [Thermomicrobiales bacterium]